MNRHRRKTMDVQHLLDHVTDNTDGGGNVVRAQAAEKATVASAKRWLEVAMACRTMQSSLAATGEELRLSSGDVTDVAPGMVPEAKSKGACKASLGKEAVCEAKSVESLCGLASTPAGSALASVTAVVRSDARGLDGAKRYALAVRVRPTMPTKRPAHDVSRSATPSPAPTQKTLPPDPDEADFSPQGNDFIACLQAITEGLAPSVFTGPDETSNDDEDAGTSVSEATAVPAGLASDIGSPRNFVMSRLFELAAFCGDLRAEAAMERGAAAAIRGQLIETRQEMEMLQASGMGAGRGGALADPAGSGDVDVGGTRGRSIPEIPPAVPGAA
ncbi:hypothetical protein HPB51_027386 [Rhipicephalus microplus]|uniref:Uncharacterized protein n=1 Tax=Rhipicephalus microplus TaxID=6941 RepID=A0A9J6D0E0_RHIMP|nr:hypothetical protein HPB51_027386 [Rhipicephalus microplus]